MNTMKYRAQREKMLTKTTTTYAARIQSSSSRTAKWYYSSSTAQKPKYKYFYFFFVFSSSASMFEALKNRIKIVRTKRNSCRSSVGIFFPSDRSQTCDTNVPPSTKKNGQKINWRLSRKTCKIANVDIIASQSHHNHIYKRKNDKIKKVDEIMLKWKKKQDRNDESREHSLLTYISCVRHEYLRIHARNDASFCSQSKFFDIIHRRHTPREKKHFRLSRALFFFFSRSDRRNYYNNNNYSKRDKHDKLWYRPQKENSQKWNKME